MFFRKHVLMALALLGLCVSLLPSCGTPGAGSKPTLRLRRNHRERRGCGSYGPRTRRNWNRGIR